MAASQEMIGEVAASFVLLHKSRGVDCVVTTTTNQSAALVAVGNDPNAWIYFLPVDRSRSYPWDRFCVSYNLWRIEDADRAFLRGDKAGAISLLRRIGDVCEPLRPAIQERLGTMGERDSLGAYRDKYDMKMHMPDAFARLAALGAESLTKLPPREEEVAGSDKGNVTNTPLKSLDR